MKKTFLIASVLVAGILSVSIAQSSSESKTSNDPVVKAMNLNNHLVLDTVPKKDTVTPKTDSSSVRF